MTVYKILYNYDTGDSFNHHPNQEKFIELEWNDIEVAKANLKRIKEHYEQYIELTDWRPYFSGTREEILDKNKNKDWFVKEDKYYDNENCIKLYTDDNKPFQFWAPWCGHFETLNFAEIVVDGDTDMKVTFN